MLLTVASCGFTLGMAVDASGPDVRPAEGFGLGSKTVYVTCHISAQRNHIFFSYIISKINQYSPQLKG